jgi:DNA replication protein DnaC
MEFTEEEFKCPYIPPCDGSGYFHNDKHVIVSKCHCLPVRFAKLQAARSGIPANYLNKSFDDFTPENDYQKEILEALKLYVDKWKVFRAEGRGISLFSKDTRCGKSHCACALTQALIEKYHPDIANFDSTFALFVNVTTWVSHWRSYFAMFGVKSKEGSEVDEEERRACVEPLWRLDKKMEIAEFLVLDDLGEVPGSAYVNSKLYALIEHRTSNALPTMITSNSSWAHIRKMYGDDGIRIADRLEELSLGYTFCFDKPLKLKKKK